jgi:hypothetical protein
MSEKAFEAECTAALKPRTEANPEELRLVESLFPDRVGDV